MQHQLISHVMASVWCMANCFPFSHYFSALFAIITTLTARHSAMDIAKLFRACRTGNIDLTRELITNKDIDLNIRDKWDSSPLYYACLCGHTDLVRLLLANGAQCDANTFDGERCVFGALTDEIRNILVKDYKVISRKVVQRRDYDEFLRKAFENGELYDVMFSVHNVLFKAHKCILAARCQYFRRLFEGKWRGRQVICLNHPLINPSAFKVLLYYLYTGTLEFHFSIKDHLLKLIRQCKLMKLFETVQNYCDNLSVKTKTKQRQVNIVIERPVYADFYQLYKSSLPDHLYPQPYAEDLGEMNQLEASNLSKFSDLIFKVDGQYFRCHKLFFFGQSDFFRALLQDHFYESHQLLDNLSVYELTDITVESFDSLICYIYTNSTLLSVENAFELIYHSDVYLMNSLKKFCANIIGSCVSQLDVIDLIKMSRMLNLPKLEKTALEYIAHNLQQFIGNESFHRLIISDAQNVKERQETDTIEIIDDIRYYLSNSSLKDIETNLKSINFLLDSLGLDIRRK